MMLGIPSSQFDKAVSFIHNVANVEVEEVECCLLYTSRCV